MDLDIKQELMPMAYKKAKGIIDKIKELRVKPELLEDDDKFDELVMKMAKAKYGENPSSKEIEGQEWYLGYLCRMSALNGNGLLMSCYEELLPYNSTEDELSSMLDSMLNS